MISGSVDYATPFMNDGEGSHDRRGNWVTRPGVLHQTGLGESRDRLPEESECILQPWRAWTFRHPKAVFPRIEQHLSHLAALF
jgi:hypothetical protein